MIWFFYNLLFPIVYLLMLPGFLLRMAKRGGYLANFGHRFGRYSAHELRVLSGPPRIWVHSVSVGEVQVGLKLIARMRERMPDARFVLTITTSTADRIARQQAHPDDLVLYFPVDFPWVVRRVLDLIHPRAFIMVETELWPNLIRQLSRRKIPIVLVNGRISDRSFPRYRRIRFLTRRLLPRIDLFCMQSEDDRTRMIELGAPSERVHALASAKYETADRDPGREAKAAEVLAAAGFGDGPVLMGGSTWPGEDAVLARVFKALAPKHPGLRLLIAPRHFEKAPDVLKTLAAEGLTFLLRSEAGPTPPAEPPQVLVLDTTGELMSFYACATVVFVGKSLCERGGQNPIEPALCGKPVVTGPDMSNFTRIMRDFSAVNAVVQVADEAALLREVDALLSDPVRAAAMGARAEQLVRANAGALTTTAGMIAGLLERD